MDNKTLDELKKHIIQVNDILLKAFDKVWEVYRLDSAGVLDRDTLRIFRNWEDAYKYYKELAQEVLNEYRKNNERLKRPTCLIDFNEYTYFLDNEYPEFGIDNKKNGDCHMWWEYEECILKESFIL